MQHQESAHNLFWFCSAALRRTIGLKDLDRRKTHLRSPEEERWTLHPIGQQMETQRLRETWMTFSECTTVGTQLSTVQVIQAKPYNNSQAILNF